LPQIGLEKAALHVEVEPEQISAKILSVVQVQGFNEHAQDLGNLGDRVGPGPDIAGLQALARRANILEG
jgi:hypothetical protein